MQFGSDICALLSAQRVRNYELSTIWCDILRTILLSANPVLHGRKKHMELDLYFVRVQVIEKKLNVNRIPTFYQIANILTKPLSKKNFLPFKQKLKVSTADNHHQVRNNLI